MVFAASALMPPDTNAALPPGHDDTLSGVAVDEMVSSQADGTACRKGLPMQAL